MLSNQPGGEGSPERRKDKAEKKIKFLLMSKKILAVISSLYGHGIHMEKYEPVLNKHI